MTTLPADVDTLDQNPNEDPSPAMSIETDTEIITHWGVRLPGGVIRWNPGYGTGVYVPYTEAQARDDAERSGGQVLTRTETTTIVTTDWVPAAEATA